MLLKSQEEMSTDGKNNKYLKQCLILPQIKTVPYDKIRINN